MNEYLQALILGVVQGLTEFLPVSSSAHLVVVPWLFGWKPMPNAMAFDVALHIGTLLAVLIYFFWDLAKIAATYIGDLRMKRWAGSARGSLVPKIVLATIPAAVIGKLLEPHTERWFYHQDGFMWILAMNLAAFGLLLVVAERYSKQERDETGISYRDAILIGAAQSIALIPGVSRSGITILVGLSLGLMRPAAARFSFLLAVPITLGAIVLKVPKIEPEMWRGPLLVGIVSSAIVGMLAIKVLIQYVQKRPYTIFAVYRWIFAAVILAVYFLRPATAAVVPAAGQ